MTENAEDYEKSSISGEMADQVVELVGYTLGLATGGQALSGATGTKAIGSAKLGMNLNGGQIGIRLAGKTLNLPTLAITGGMAGGLQEANSKGENVTEVERWGKAFSSGIIEGITEGIFGFLGVGGNELTDELGKKLASKFTSKVAKVLTNLGFHATGEAAEEFLSYASNFLVDNGIIDNLGSTDFSSEWDWGEVFEQMLLAFLSTGLTGGSAMIVDTNSAVKSAEEQLGRNLSQEEKQLVTKAVVDEALQEKIQEMYNQEDIPQEFYVSTFNTDGSIASVEQTRGKLIDNPNKKVNVQPAIVRTGNNIYTIIDAKTGLRLDTTPYDSTLAAESGFNSKMINLKERDINAINTKIGMTNISVTDTLVNTAQAIQNDIAKRRNTIQTSQNSFTDVLNTQAILYSSQSNNAVKSQNKGSKIGNKNKVAISNLQIDEEVTDAYSGQTNMKMSAKIGDKVVGTLTYNEYEGTPSIDMIEVEPEYRRQGVATKLVQQLQEKYPNIEINWGTLSEDGANFKNAVTYNVENIEVKKKQKRLDNQKDYKNFVKLDINSTTKSNPKRTKIEAKIEKFIQQNPNLEATVEIITSGLENVNVKEIKQMEAYKIARDLFAKLHKIKFTNNMTGNIIYVTNSDIKESINNTYTFTEQRKYLKENLSIYSHLDKIIVNAQLISNTSELKGRSKYNKWEYYALPIKIDNRNFIVQFDTVQREDGETHFRVERLFKISEGDSTTAVPTKKLMTRFSVESPSVNNSISQKENPVKENTNVNNKSMQNKKNNTQDINIRTEKINNTTEYDSQGNKLTKTQQEFFKNSKVRDKKGNLLVVYHGTNNFGFTEFRRSANFYTSREDVASTYTGNSGIYRGYLNIKNPIVIDAQKEKWSMIDIDNIKIVGINDVREFLHKQGASVWQEKGKTRTSTADLVQAISDAIDEGQLNADGIIIQNIYDEGIYSNGETKLGTDYITFKSNQFKNIDNQKPTSNPDIRYEKIKPTKTSDSKTLLAQHNTSEEKLLEALDLGSLPVPSIAITKYQNPLLKYGDITLLFNKDTINPTDKRNVTYNSDIYSTRKPQIAYTLNKTKAKIFENIAKQNGISVSYIDMIEEYIQNNDFTRAKEIIQYELESSNDNVSAQEVENLFASAMEMIDQKRIMKDGVDPYYPDGSRKSLTQMSIEYNLDNIVKYMTKKSIQGSEHTFSTGVAEIRANMAQKFKSIEEMHKMENNLVTAEEMEELKSKLYDDFYKLTEEISKYDKVDRYFGSTDTIAEALNEVAKSKNVTIDVLENELSYVSIDNVPKNVLKDAVDFLNSLRNVPTEYFEAKPQRAVSFDEVQKAIVPQNTSKEIIDKLKNKGIPIEYYSTDEQRQNLISNNDSIRFERNRTAKRQNENIPYNEKEQLDSKNLFRNIKESNYLQTLLSVDDSQGATNAQNSERLIEQQIQYVESMGAFDDNIPVTKLSDIQKTIEDYLGKGIQKRHFRERAYGIYKTKNDTIRVKELKDIDNILHETAHALDIGKRLNINKESIANELLEAARKHGGYENELRNIQLEEGFAEVIRTYAINPSQAKIDYPQTVSVLEEIRLQDESFNNFIQKVQTQIYNYIHQNPRNRVLSNVSIGEQTDKPARTPKTFKENAMRLIYDKDYLLKSTVNEFAKLSGKGVNQIAPSRNAYILTRLASGVHNKAISMISDGYIDLNGNRLMPGLNQLGEILGNDPQRFNDLRAYLVAKRDLEYKAKTLKTGIRSMDSKAIVEQFSNDTQIQEASRLVYDTLNGVLQYAVNNGLISQETASSLKESNVFYVPFQRVIGNNGNQVGRRGSVAEIIKTRTGSELDIKDVLENIVVNSSNIIQQVENNNVLKALYEQGEETGMKNNIFDVIPTPVRKVGTATLATWENELKNQGVDTKNIDFEKTIDIFAPDNKIDRQNLITSFINTNGERVYLQFYHDDIFNSIMGLDKNSNSLFLRFMRKANMPLRYGATMANIGFAIPNMISDTAQAAIYSEAGFIPVVDNVLGVLDILTATNKTVRNFVNKYSSEYVERINRIYDIYQQTGSSSSTRLSQYRKSAQEIMKDIYGTKNSETLGIKESFKPLKRLLDIMTYIPELSEQSTRFRVFERNYEAYKNKGGSELDARIKAAMEARDATQDFGRTGTAMREINQLIPFSAARVGSIYTFSEKVTQNTRTVATRVALLSVIALIIKSMGYNDKEIEELNQRKKNDNFVLKIGDTIVTIKKPQGILRSILNLDEYILDLITGNIEEEKEGERLAEWLETALMDNLPADEVGGLVPNAIAPIIENSINKDFYYNTNIVKSWDLNLPESQQYYDYTSQLAIWLGQIFNYSPAKIDNLISGYFGGLGTQVTNVIDWISGQLGLSAEEPAMGAEDNAVGKRFIVNVNENSASIDEVYTREEELTKKLNGGTITDEENKELENLKTAISNLAALNKKIKAIKQDLTMSGTEKAEAIRPLQEQKTDVARQALGKEPIYNYDEELESVKFYPSRSTLSYKGYTLNLTEEMKKEYENLAYSMYKKYERQGLYSKEYLEKLETKCKDYAKNTLIQKYRNQLIKD